MLMCCRSYQSVKKCWKIIVVNINLPAPENRLADIIRHINTFCSFVMDLSSQESGMET